MMAWQKDQHWMLGSFVSTSEICSIALCGIACVVLHGVSTFWCSIVVVSCLDLGPEFRDQTGTRVVVLVDVISMAMGFDIWPTSKTKKRACLKVDGHVVALDARDSVMINYMAIRVIYCARRGL